MYIYTKEKSIVLFVCPCMWEDFLEDGENGQMTFLKTSISVNKEQRGKKQTKPLTLTLQFNTSSNP